MGKLCHTALILGEGPTEFFYFKSLCDVFKRLTIKPDYPKGARQRGEQGDVVLELSINRSGGVDAVTVVGSCGFQELDDAAVAAAKKARFTPAKSGDSAVASTARLKLTVKLK